MIVQLSPGDVATVLAKDFDSSKVYPLIKRKWKENRAFVPIKLKRYTEVVNSWVLGNLTTIFRSMAGLRPSSNTKTKLHEVQFRAAQLDFDRLHRSFEAFKLKHCRPKILVCVVFFIGCWNNDTNYPEITTSSQQNNQGCTQNDAYAWTASYHVVKTMKWTW